MAPTADVNAVFEGLAIEPSAEPLPPPSRGGNPTLPNPFADPLKASVEHDTPYSIYIPANAVQRAVFLINSAARKNDLGVRVVVNVQRDKDGKIVKGADGKAQYVQETSGANKGKVLVRFQGKRERKQQQAPRPYSIVKVKGEEGQFYVRERSSKRNVFKGTHDEAKAKYDELKNAVVSAAQAPATEAPTQGETGSSQPATPSAA